MSCLYIRLLACRSHCPLAPCSGKGGCLESTTRSPEVTLATGVGNARAQRLTWSPGSHSDEDPEDAVLPKDKLVSLCKCDPILKWMRSCDHILYQALVETLIPDVLRPVPSEQPATRRLPPLPLVGWGQSSREDRQLSPVTHPEGGGPRGPQGSPPARPICWSLRVVWTGFQPISLLRFRH